MNRSSCQLTRWNGCHTWQASTREYNCCSQILPSGEIGSANPTGTLAVLLLWIACWRGEWLTWWMCAGTWMAGAVSTMHSVVVQGDSYRLIPSHFPPIALFENLLDPRELDAAYALESLTNDRVRDQVGNIALVSPDDRVTGNGTTAIMAAFTHVGIESRFTKGLYGV